MKIKNQYLLLAVSIIVAVAAAGSYATKPGVTAQEPSAENAIPASQENDGATKLVTAADLGLPKPGMVVDPTNTAIVITDPQNDFLSPDGAAWGVVGESVTENGTVENLEALFRVAANYEVPVFVSPHYYFPHDHNWKFEGALEHLMHDIKMFDRPGQIDTTGLNDSGADWLERYKPYISRNNVVVTSPHKVYGPESNDLVLQLRKRGINKIILGGMSANLCTESHMRELIEQGFEVTVVEDATAGAKTPAGDAHQVAVANFHYITSAVVTTDQAVAAIQAAFGESAVQ